MSLAAAFLGLKCVSRVVLSPTRSSPGIPLLVYTSQGELAAQPPPGVILHISDPFSPPASRFPVSPGHPVVHALNKADLISTPLAEGLAARIDSRNQQAAVQIVSAKTGHGILDLVKKLAETLSLQTDATGDPFQVGKVC